MDRTIKYFKGILSIFRIVTFFTVDFVALMGIIYSIHMLCKVMSTRGSMPMTTEQSILVWGAILFTACIVFCVITYTVIFFFWPELIKEKEKETIEGIARKHGKRLKKLEDEIALLKKQKATTTRKRRVKVNKIE